MILHLNQRTNFVLALQSCSIQCQFGIVVFLKEFLLYHGKRKQQHKAKVKKSSLLQIIVKVQQYETPCKGLLETFTKHTTCIILGAKDFCYLLKQHQTCLHFTLQTNGQYGQSTNSYNFPFYLFGRKREGESATIDIFVLDSRIRFCYFISFHQLIPLNTS